MISILHAKMNLIFKTTSNIFLTMQKLNYFIWKIAILKSE